MQSNSTYLLDTSTFIWWITDSASLSVAAKKIISDAKNKILVSSISGWEIAIKAKLGRLKKIGDPELSIPFHIKRNNFEMLDFSMSAALKVFNLPILHQDPFDRALIAQAAVLEIPIISADTIFNKYAVEVKW